MKSVTLTLLFTLFLTPTQAQEVIVSTLQLDGPLSLDGLVVATDGTLYGADGFDGNNVYHIQKDGTSSIRANFMAGPIDMDFDADGHLYVSTFLDRGFQRIDMQTGYYEQWARVAVGPSGVAINRVAGKAYISHYGAGQLGNGNAIYEVDLGTRETTIFAQDQGLNAPVSLAIDEAGNVYAANIVDAQVFKITPDGTVTLLTTLPTRHPAVYNIGHIAYTRGALYVTGNRAMPYIYRVNLDGSYEVIAGTGENGIQDGLGLQATFAGPNGITPSVTGDSLYVTELNNPSALRIIALPPTATSMHDPTIFTPGYTLTQTYPNPVLPPNTTSVSFSYTLPVPQHVTIRLYDALGREHMSRPPVLKQAGAHQVSVSTKNLAPGVYFYTMQTEDIMLTKSLLVAD